MTCFSSCSSSSSRSSSSCCSSSSSSKTSGNKLDLEIGDIIKIHRTFYYHSALVVGNDALIHVIRTAAECKIGIESFDIVVAGCRWEKGNDYDNIKTPLPKEQIFQKAVSKAGKYDYDVTKNNCDHFVTECRYGEAFSKQVNNEFKKSFAMGAEIMAKSVCSSSQICSCKKDDNVQSDESNRIV
uniref:LRAT domain-containing protein n=1 Tax=Biomphalaria glabrata TaxID=6526 RepID=A0A2C9KK88_BIOGL